jgi:hypothetical protein
MSGTERRSSPVGSRFRKGQSGNPKGRPKSTARAAAPSAFDIVIDRTLAVSQGGEPREVTVEEALQHRTYQAAIAGNRSARREILRMIAKRETYLAKRRETRAVRIEFRTEDDPSNADVALLILGIASRNPHRLGRDFNGEQLLLEPWAVQAALGRRRGAKRLSRKDLDEIRRCTRDRHSVRWPPVAKA